MLNTARVLATSWVWLSAAKRNVERFCASTARRAAWRWMLATNKVRKKPGNTVIKTSRISLDLKLNSHDLPIDVIIVSVDLSPD